MKFVLIILLLCIAILLFYLLKSKQVNILITIVLTSFIIYFILNPTLCIESSIKGAKLFFNSLFPSLFPFLVMTNILVAYDGVSIYAKLLGPIMCKPLGLPKESSFALIVSLLCGYPLGAKYSCELYDSGSITPSQFSKLVNVASNSSPLFLVGAVGTSMLGSTKSGYLLLFSNYLSCVIIALILSSSNNNIMTNLKITKETRIYNFGTVLKESIENALKTTLSIGSYVVLFSVILSIIKNNAIYNIVLDKLYIISFLPKETLNGIFLGFIEVTNGCYILSQSSINYALKLSFISFLCAFSGLAIMAQVHSFTYKYEEISIIRYFLRKVLQGLISFCITFTTTLFIGEKILCTSSQIMPSVINYKNYIPVLLLVFISLISYISKKLFNVS
ncbi:sporulation integral membrane protein YlbJ [Clostridium amazonitimonense]|uniref:sporulation integral membrane protein YlbJ n=1 Tax=Clostridium amazonitimonense TaxID=1499689 RepID=UPI00050995F3|nr:sporulation integral membrane protein YlbJ [Clostridium amazonitimonense]